MVKRMLVDANHPEETRVVVLDGTRLEEFDLETSTKKQNKGNIYLAKVVRVEPSLQAAFVDYGGNRHGFLAFSEIHPDYYQIPVADREALLAEVNAHHEDLADEDDVEQNQQPSRTAEQDNADTADADPPPSPADADAVTDKENEGDPGDDGDADAPNQPNAWSENPFSIGWDIEADPAGSNAENDQQPIESQNEENAADPNKGRENADQIDVPMISKSSGIEEIGGEDEAEENLDVHRRKFVSSRRYKIQEVIKRRQILLVQVVKEERGTKGAALTTYLSLAGRYCVLMPNSSRGGGVSRKITNSKDRRRLKSILNDLNIVDHMAVILRTAGAERSKAEVKRDYEYLQRTWNHIRDITMESRAPALIHEEANLIKRSIRDIYSRDIEEILVEGEEGYRAAKEFMKTLTPSHAKKVKRYKDDAIPLLHRYQVESQLDAMHSPTVQLKSGGSIVFGQTEALVAIDVNSGKATRERHIEETALKTNLEAAEEIARQLRLRDLAGLVVIDFIDMDENRNNHAVERRLKEALKSDRARIQVGRISHFGLLELSRQRLRPSLIEANFEVCNTCAGTGLIRSIESTSIQTLRAIEEEGLRNRTQELTVHVHPDVALYILNYKRSGLEDIQARYGMNVFVLGDDSLVPPDIKMDRVKSDTSKSGSDQKKTVKEVDDTPADDEALDFNADEDGDGGKKRKRRRRRKRRGDGEDGEVKATQEADSESAAGDSQEEDRAADGEPQKKTRRRGRRGGRRRKRDDRPQSDAAGSEDKPAGADSAAEEQSPVGPIDQGNAATGSDQPAGPDQVADPIPVQPAASLEPQPPSRFLDVFRRGADALISSASGSNSSPADKSPQQTQDKAEQTDTDVAPAAAPAANETPPAKTSDPTGSQETDSEPPRRGWWNQEESGS